MFLVSVRFVPRFFRASFAVVETEFRVRAADLLLRRLAPFPEIDLRRRRLVFAQFSPIGNWRKIGLISKAEARSMFVSAADPAASTL